MSRVQAPFDVETLASGITIAGSSTTKRFSVGARGAKSVDFLLIGTCGGAVPVLSFESRAINGATAIAVPIATGGAHGILVDPGFKAAFVAGDVATGITGSVEASAGGTGFDTEHRIAVHEVILKIVTAAGAGDTLTGVTVIAVLNF